MGDAEMVAGRCVLMAGGLWELHGFLDAPVVLTLHKVRRVVPRITVEFRSLKKINSGKESQ